MIKIEHSQDDVCYWPETGIRLNAPFKPLSVNQEVVTVLALQ